MQGLGKAWPLRPELMESAFMLWSHTGDPRYKRLGEGTFELLQERSRCKCGYCGVKDVGNGAPLLLLTARRPQSAPALTVNYELRMVPKSGGNCTAIVAAAASAPPPRAEAPAVLSGGRGRV